MARKSTVLRVGWNPDIVDGSQWPGLKPAKLRAGLEGNRAKREASGYDVLQGLIDSSEAADQALRHLLTSRERDGVLMRSL